jgi:hypothetical protein
MSMTNLAYVRRMLHDVADGRLTAEEAFTRLYDADAIAPEPDNA